MDIVTAMFAVIEPDPPVHVVYLGESQMIQVTRYRHGNSMRSDAEAIAYAEASPLYSYYGKGWWMLRSKITDGAYDAWPNPWTTPDNQEKRK